MIFDELFVKNDIINLSGLKDQYFEKLNLMEFDVKNNVIDYNVVFCELLIHKLRE